MEKKMDFIKLYVAPKQVLYGRLVGESWALSSEYKEEDGYTTPFFSLGYTSLSTKQAGMQDIHGLGLTPISEDLLVPLKYAVGGSSSYMETLLSKATHIVDGRNEGVEIPLNGNSSQFAYGIHKDVFGQAVESKKVSVNHVYKYKASFGSVSGTRNGFGTYMLDNASYKNMVEKLDIHLDSFINNHSFNATKAATRMRLSNSSGYVWGLFDGYSFVSKRRVSYDYKDGGKTYSTQYTLIKEGVERVVEVFKEDFTVSTMETITGPQFNGPNGKVVWGEWEQEMLRAATDGNGFISPDFLRESGLSCSALTIRMTSLVKGLLVATPRLKEGSNVDMMLFGGMVKGNIDAFFTRSNLKAMALIESRSGRDSHVVALGRQVTLRGLNDETTLASQKNTANLGHGCLNLKEESVNKLVYMGQERIDLAEEGSLDVGDSTIQLFNANRELFMKDYSFRESLRNSVSRKLEKLHLGKQHLVEGASWRHMVVDPYAVLSALRQGLMFVEREGNGSVGISRKNAFSILNGEINSEKCVVYRFPFLHQWEARLLNASNTPLFVDNSSKSYYEKAAKEGYFQGLMIYSLWDMEPEAQSGADFDGDQSVWVTNEMIVAQTEEYPLFLDYSQVWENGEFVTVEGCPFGESEALYPDKHLSATEVDALNQDGITWNDKGVFHIPGEVSPLSQEAIWHSTATMTMDALSSNHIGMFTHISDTVCEMKKTLLSKGEDASGLERLELLLAVSIRWEIDKAKHGGAFYEELNFLSILTEGGTVKQIKSAEKEFGISLGLFFS